MNGINPAEHLSEILIEPAPDLFFSRNDGSDQRMGDLVLRKVDTFVPEVRVGIVGVPFDEGVRRNRGRVGASQAPNEIRRALYKLTPFTTDTRTDISASASTLRMFDFGNIREGKTLEDTHENLEYAVEVLLQEGIFPIVLGGGHDIAYPNCCGFAKHAARVGVVNIDAHLDYRKPAPERNSGTPFRQMLDNAACNLVPERLVEIGIQSFANSAQHYRELQERGAEIVPLQTVRVQGMEYCMREALERVSAHKSRVFVSFDMDAVRSSDAPGVSAPSPVGLFAEDMLIAARMTGEHPAVGMIDIVETNPMYDTDGRTAKLAALVIMNVLAGFAERA